MLYFHIVPFALARVEGHRIRTASGLAKIAHSFRLDPRHHPITLSRRADLQSRVFRNRFAISFEELCHCSFPLTNTMLELFPWGQVTSERDKSGVTKLSHHAKKFLSQCGKSRPVSTWGQLLAIILFFQASCSFSASPSSLVTKKANIMAGDRRLRQNGMIIALTLYDMK